MHNGCYDRTEGIILAAGLSKRAGAFKMTLEIEGKTLIERCIEGMYGVCSRIVVVAGCGYEKLLPIISRYSKVEPVFNENYEDGMYSSVKKGLKELKGDCFFLTPGDCPLISREVYESLLGSEGTIIIPAYKGQTGHPVFMKSDLIGEILKDSSYSSLEEFINSKGYEKVEVRNRGILMDVDTPEDFERVLKYAYKNGWGQ